MKPSSARALIWMSVIWTLPHVLPVPAVAEEPGAGEGESSVAGPSPAFRFGLESFFVFELQGLHGDSGLALGERNAELDLTRTGLRVPVRIPGLSGGRGVAISFALEAAVADLDLDLGNAGQAGLSSIAEASGQIYGAGILVTTPSSSRWRAQAGYWFHYLAGAALADDSTLEGRFHELSARFGPNAGELCHFYAGLAFRSTEIEIDRGSVPSDEGLEPRSGQRFGSDKILAIAGLRFAFSPVLEGRMESLFGDGDFGVGFQVSWNRWRGEGSGRASGRESRKAAQQAAKRSRHFEKWQRRFASLVPSLLIRLAEIEKEFRIGRRALEAVRGSGGRDPSLEREVRALLDETQEALVDLLSGRRSRRRDLAPLRDFVRYRFERTLEALEALSTAAGGGIADARPAARSTALYASFDASRRSRARPVLAESSEGRLFERVLSCFQAVFPFLRTAIEDPECRDVTIRFDTDLRGAGRPPLLVVSTPRRPRARVYDLDAVADPARVANFPASGRIPRGAYGFEVREEAGAEPWRRCQDAPPGAGAVFSCPLDLVEEPLPEVVCWDFGAPAGDCRQSGEVELPEKCMHSAPACW